MTQATSALRNMQKFLLLGKEIRIEYAKKHSDSVSQMMGKYKPPRPRTVKNSSNEEEMDD